jgi:hypothetical protein
MYTMFVIYSSEYRKHSSNEIDILPKFTVYVSRENMIYL